METYIESLRRYLETQKIQFAWDTPQPCLDMLWWQYCECHRLENETTRAYTDALWKHMDKLPFLQADALFSEMLLLCSEYERLAFTAGIQLGAQLMLELQSK